MSQPDTPKKTNEKPEDTNNVQKLLSALQSAQGKSVTTTSIPKIDKKKNNKKLNVVNKDEVQQQQQPEASALKAKKKKKKKKSVAERMQQQQENVCVANVTKRQRNTSVSKNHTPRVKCPRIPEDVLNDLEFRFISNLPTNDKMNTIRVCFQTELAHWFYIDHIVEKEERKDCPPIGFRDFSKSFFSHCEELRKMANNCDEIIAQWREYTYTVPTYGAILIDETLENVLLVQSYYCKGNKWGFPKGKINQNEPPRECAIRETLEETGFDFGTVSKKEKIIEKVIGDSMIRLYIVLNVPSNFPFAPQTRKEIRKIQWFRIADLPTDRAESVPPYLEGHVFFMVIPFMHEIQRYVEEELEKTNAKTQGTPSIFSQLFPNAVLNERSAESNTNPIFTRMTSEELFSSFRKSDLPKTCLSVMTEAEREETISTAEEIVRPTLTQMSPGVRGMDILASLGLCTPLKPPENSGSFPTNNEAVFHSQTKNETPLVGFAMPTTLQKPVVTSAHPWQLGKKEEPYHGWLDSQFVNTVMHPPIETGSSSENRNLSHLISQPIQPQPIMPVAATQSALESAEAPKRSSRISLSDNSAFTAITSKTSQANPTSAPTSNEEQRRRSDSQSNAGNRTITPSSCNASRKGISMATRSLFTSIASPVSSGMRSIHGDSSLSLDASIKELSFINKGGSPILAQEQEQYGSASMLEVKCCNTWKVPIKIDYDLVVGPVDLWKRGFTFDE